MTFLPPEGPLPELSTTRVGGGFSARLIAVAVAGMLIAVVGFTVANRPPAPPVPSSTAPAVAAVPTPLPTPAPPRNQIEGNDGIFSWPVVAQIGPYRGRPTQVQRYQYAVSTSITGGRVRVQMTPQVEDVYSGQVVVDAADVGNSVRLEMGRQRSELGMQIFETFDAWDVGVQPLLKSRGGLVQLLVEHVPPDVSTPGVPGPVASGYTFTLMGRRQGSQLTLLMELVWPDGAQFAQFEGPRDPALYNRCRWDVGPLAAPPRPGTNEADC